MEIYKVKKNQNIYDIALLLYGTIEGIYDLLLSNSTLSLDDDLTDGQELYYHDEFVINSNVVNYFQDNGIVPINGESKIYYKEIAEPIKIIIDHYDKNTNYIEFSCSGSGVMIIDWGDNSQIEKLTLNNQLQQYIHYFDTKQGNHSVNVHGDFSFKILDVSKICGDCLFVAPIVIDEFISKSNNNSLLLLFLSKNTYHVDLSGSTIYTLLPIINLHLQELNLLEATISQEILDEYFLNLISNYGTRRNCIIKLSKQPSGEYREPSKSVSDNYICKNGMEAIWLLTHDEVWNENGAWEIIINNKTYKYES